VPDGVQPVFYYDLGSPECYLAAERVMATLPVVPEWMPVDGGVLPAPAVDPDARRAAVERAAATHHVQALRWPPGWPADVRPALLAATYAKQIGRAVAFSLAAFRQAFAGGRDLGDVDTVLIAAAACEMHPRAVLQALERAPVAAALAAASADAAAAGVRALPAVRVGTQVFHGPDGLDAAGAALEAALAGAPPPP
jgi:2-hydroxychromene-2-carboxylate isomerase